MLQAYRLFFCQLKQRLQSLFRVAKSVNNVATLTARQIYILPTRWSLFYALMLLALLIGAINYTLSLAYFVTFLLAALGNTAMLYTWRNLAYLEVSVGQSQAVFAGDIAEINIEVRNLRNRTRYAIYTQFKNNRAISQSIQANESSHFKVPLVANQRGYLIAPKLKLYTEFPLSLFHAWAIVDSETQVLVYPAPKGQQITIPCGIDPESTGKHAILTGDEDFVGHKAYQVGDLPSKVDWKASSRGIGMYSKQFSGEAAASLYLDWAQTNGDIETRISQLTRWVIDAHAAQLEYGLRLSDQVQLAPSNTDAHYHACLKALATR